MNIHVKKSRIAKALSLQEQDPRITLSLSSCVQEKATDSLHGALSAVAALILFIGLSAVLLHVFGLQDQSFAYLPALAVGCIAIASCFILEKRAKNVRKGYLIFAAIIAVVAIALNGAIKSGAAIALNSLDALMGERSSIYNLPLIAGQDADLAVFLCFAAVLIGVVCALMALHGNVVLCTVLCLVITLFVLWGLTEFTPWIYALAAGVLLCFSVNTSLLNDVRDGLVLAKTLGGILAVTIALSGIAFAFIYVVDLDTSAQRQAIAEFVDGLRYGGRGWAMPQGKLNDLGALRGSSQEALLVQMPDNGLGGYLRGFVGEVYSDGEWSSLPASEVIDNENVLYWLTQQGFSAASQLADASEVLGFSETEKAEATITYQGARNTFAYLPYTFAQVANEGEEGTVNPYTLVTDQSNMLRDVRQRTVSIEYASSSLQKAYRIQGRLYDEQESAQGSLDTYLDSENSYRSFVERYYVALPRRLQAVFKQIAGEQEELDADAAKERVLTILDALVEYNEDVVTENGDIDFAEFFLTQSKSGYNVHYATAATLLMRYFGVPARYVEGYLVGIDSGTVQLTEYNAHAWCEYYLDGVGWVVFDPTPGFRDGSFYEASDNSRVSEYGELYDAGSKLHNPWTPPESETDQDKRHQSKNNLLDIRFSRWFFIGLLVALVVGAILHARRKHRALEAMYDGFATDDASEAVTDMFTFALHLAKHGLGVQFANAPYTIQGAIAQQSGMCSAQTFMHAADINQRALLSKEEISEKDRSDMLAFLGEVEDAVKAESSAVSRFWLSWVRGIIR